MCVRMGVYMWTIWNQDGGHKSHLEAIFGLSWALSGFKNETSKIVTSLAPELCFRVWRAKEGPKSLFFKTTNPSETL